MKRWCWIMLGTAMACGAGGCEKALFQEQAPRTQYERFDRLRGGYQPPVTYSPDGEEVPNLRARLMPYSQ
ncbi:MAG: hypothetical protein WC058_10640 [Phycisphaeraceae bacterium]